MRVRLSLLSLSLLLAACATGGSSTSHPGHAAPHWGYAGEAGPERWGALSSEYATCATGTQQSPVNLSAPATAELPELALAWGKSGYHLSNNGHTIQAAYDTGSALTLDGAVYTLAQFHFHAPSEHTLEGKAFPGEVHFVHKSAAGNLAVVGVFLDKGAENPALTTLLDNLPAAAGATTAPAGELEATALLPADKSYFTYLGSLTTPPCSEQVHWYVMKQPITLSEAQWAKFTALYQGNARPVQDLHGRPLQVRQTP